MTGIPSDWVRIGGGEHVSALMTRFVQAMAADFVIGFLFEGKDLERIARHEAELAGALLGGPSAYAGRPIGALHRPLKINRGQFRRRLFLLRATLEEGAVPPDVVERWIAHHASLEVHVTLPIDCVE